MRFTGGMAEVKVDEGRLVALFKVLCLTNAPAKRERPVVDKVKELLTEMGLEVREDDAGEKTGGDSGNVLALLKSTKADAPSVFLSAHFDTVEPTEGLRIIEDDGVLRTDGTTILGADDKGGMAPAIEAVRMLQESGVPHGDVWLLFSVQEEIGLLGAGALDIQSLNVDYGYVLDTGPPVGSFVTRTATHDKLDVTVIGKPAHAGKHPEEGINAIQVAARAIDGMKIGRIDAETTANFGIVSGGTAVNVVCPSVTLRGEARSTNVHTLNTQIAHMRECFDKAAADFGASVEFDYERHYEAYEISADEPVVKVGQAASRALGFDPVLRTTLGGSDANMYNQAGVPTIVVGTGMEKIHTHEEYISIKDLVNTARLSYQILLEASK